MTQSFRFMPLVLLLALCSFQKQNGNNKEMQVMKAAEGQMDLNLSKIKPGEERNYGFTTFDSMDLCSIGKPYRLLEFTNEFYTGPLDENGNYITITNDWRVPVVLGSQHRFLFSVSGNPGNYSISGMGDAGVARELQKLSQSARDSDEFYILTVYPLFAEFYGQESNNSFSEIRLIPLASAYIAIPGLRSGASYSLSEVQDMVKKAIDARKKPAPIKEAPVKPKPKKKALK